MRPPVQPKHKAAAGQGQVLTQAMLTSNAPAGQLSSVVKLDLGLERLTGLSGLELWCPNLKVWVWLHGYDVGIFYAIGQVGG